MSVRRSSVKRPRASVFLAASSREQASVVFAYAKDVALHPALDGSIVVRHLELRAPDGGACACLPPTPRSCKA